jgi:hypothetical protein
MTDSLSGLSASTEAFAVTDEYGQLQPSGPVTVGSNGRYSFVINLQASRPGNNGVKQKGIDSAGVVRDAC